MTPWPRVPVCFEPGSFQPEAHYYARALNAVVHPLVRFFMSLSTERIVSRYAHMNPRVDPEALTRLLASPTRHLRWSGCDLMHATDVDGNRHMVVIETNSSPSGQKSMPLLDEDEEQGGYHRLVHQVVVPWVTRKRLPEGGLAVLYDKNPMETSGYAAALADAFDEPVTLVPCFDGAPEPWHRFDEHGVLHIRDEAGPWRSIRFALRYVTQRPWNRLPLHSRTALLNPILGCLAGGRNKMVAAKAYDIFNAELARDGLRILTPRTIWDVGLAEVPLWVRRMGGHAVVKVPYANAGQGVYTITDPAELDAFMAQSQRYDKFIVQSLVGNAGWSSDTDLGRLYHVGNVPTKKNHIYVSDFRFMVGSTPEGLRPLAVYARRTRKPLTREPPTDSWAQLGTNLSVKREDGTWDTESHRLMLMDERDFNKLGLGLDDLVEAFIQTVLAVHAVDRMASDLLNQKKRFRMRLFRTLDDDPALLSEILP